ncbi:hypothetical protein ACFZBU_39570 [Embleya sp. NPDC008237]|uniref:hypothetical protein n=1 Tax=Embleya sp. NPDC008237 TaxID=3363978 RepID=UPI0036E7EF3A
MAQPRAGDGFTYAGNKDGVVIATPDRALAVLNPADGAVRTRTPFPDGGFHGVHATATLGLAHVGERVLLAPLDTTSPPIALTVPPGSEVSTTGDAVLITAPGDTAMIADRDGTHGVPLPPGTHALAADGDTVIAATPAGPWWRARTTGAPPVQVTPTPPRPDARVRSVTAAGHDRVLVLWSGPESSTTTTALHDAKTGAVILAAQVPSTELTGAYLLWDGGPVAGFGPLVLDMRTGRHVVVPTFRAASIRGTTVFGHLRSGQSRTAVGVDTNDLQAPPRPLGPSTPLPWADAKGRALVGDLDTDGVFRIYALDPA